MPARLRLGLQTVNYDLSSNFAGSMSRLAEIHSSFAAILQTPMQISATCRWKECWCSQKEPIFLHAGPFPSAHFTGTMETPQGSVDLDFSNAVLYDEPVDHVRTKRTQRFGATRRRTHV